MRAGWPLGQLNFHSYTSMAQSENIHGHREQAASPARAKHCRPASRRHVGAMFWPGADRARP
jgi:hypothetical protein